MSPRERRPAPYSRTQVSAEGEIDAFIAKARHDPSASGRLVFALDATMSRQATWDMACHLQAGMFDAVRGIGNLSVKLAYFRGYQEAQATRWLGDADALTRVMGHIHCAGGKTQIGRMLALVERDAQTGPAPLLVFVGDSMEENVDALCERAGRLSLYGVRAFMFQEGTDPIAQRAFTAIAQLTGGVYRRFDAGAADSLRDLLAGAAIFAAGGKAALEASGDRAARALLGDLR